ncbi:MAG: DedA family protein [Chlorobiaceae bacterium]|nr:DedA family protein [Chlorobiaceae bacterium]NTW09949.1 DedA family protein [Chlorobiaceae bacterium]
MSIADAFQQIPTLDEVILWGGYLLLFIIVFSETGLFAGFFLPGDSLLITSGLIAATGELDIFMVIATLSCGAVCGDTTGYLIGRQLDKSIFEKKESRFFHPEYLEKTREFYRKHGSKAVFLARFVPFVRSFAASLAGVVAMPYPIFLFFSVTGAVAWVVTFTLIGYFVAHAFPDIVRYFHMLIFAGILLIIASSLKNLKLQKKQK